MRTKILIVYKSKYGSIKQYAKWIHDEIDCDLCDVKGKEQFDFQNYDTIMFGSYLRLGAIKIAQFVINNWDKIKDKKIILFTASGFPVEHPQIRKIYEDCFPKNIREEIKQGMQNFDGVKQENLMPLLDYLKQNGI